MCNILFLDIPCMQKALHSLYYNKQRASSCTSGGNRTHTSLRTYDFESHASTNSATEAGRQRRYHFHPECVRGFRVKVGQRKPSGGSVAAQIPRPGGNRASHPVSRTAQRPKHMASAASWRREVGFLAPDHWIIFRARVSACFLASGPLR